MPASLLWFRNDLRLHDHEPLLDAVEAAGPDGRLLAVYCLDPRHYAETPYGFRKTEGYRAAFVLESLRDLRGRMRSLGSDLVVRQGRPEDVLPPLAEQTGAASIHLHDEPMQEEMEVEQALREALPDLTWNVVWGHTLVSLDDLPFEVADAPDVFTQFRKAVEKGPAGDYYAPEPAPEALPPTPDGVGPGAIPESVDALGVAPRETDDRLGFRMRGGETAGLKRLDHYLWDADRLRVYKETRNGMLAPDDSSKLSAWLAHGCLSPRRVQAEVRRYEAERVKNRSTYWLTFELLWRDFFRLYGAKYGDRLFWPSGPKGVAGMPERLDEGLFAAWRDGRTGLPMVDASMRELNETGFMSNRGRQNVASFFAKHLKQPWWVGAAYFEALLVDYDVTSNWGNWAYNAGVGSDPRDRYFDVELQLRKYDEDAAFVKHWLPALRDLPPKQAREPYRMSDAEQERHGVVLGEDYPVPVIDYDRVTQALREGSRPGRDDRGSKQGGPRRKRGNRRQR
ncbi:MAG: DASH family cryptochrome [Bacteroidota bacterium]